MNFLLKKKNDKKDLLWLIGIIEIGKKNKIVPNILNDRTAESIFGFFNKYLELGTKIITD